MKSLHQTPRRTFLRRVGTGMAVVASSVPASVCRAAEPAIRVGIIGCGVRGGKTLLSGLQVLPGVRITAVCDVYEKNLEAARLAAGAGVLATVDYRRVLDNTEVDAVVIAAPDHHHVPMTIEAIAAGKDVYVEKPLTHSLDETDTILRATEASSCIVQVGTQQRSMPQFQRAKELVQGGTVGPVRYVRMWWNRNATPYQRKVFDVTADQVDWNKFLGGSSDRPFDPFVMMQWRFFWDFGGGSFTDLMIHWLDAAAWVLNLGIPKSVYSIGNHFVGGEDYEIPHSVQCLMQYAHEDLQASFCSMFVNSYEETGLEIRSEKATIFLDRSRLELHPESKHGLKPIEMILDPTQRRGRGADGRVKDGKTGTVLHLENWLESIRTRQPPVATVACVLAATNTAHYANLSLRESRSILPTRIRRD